MKKEVASDFFIARAIAYATGRTYTITCPSAATGENIVSAQTLFYVTPLSDAEVDALILSADTPSMFDLTSSFINTDHNVTKDDTQRVTSYKFITIYCNDNTNGDERYGRVYIKQRNTVLATILVHQAGKEHRERFESFCGDYGWEIGEEHHTEGYWVWEERTPGGSWIETNRVDVDDDVTWSGMVESGLFEEVSRHTFRAIATGYTGTDVRARYDGTYGSDWETHSYEVYN